MPKVTNSKTYKYQNRQIQKQTINKTGKYLNWKKLTLRYRDKTRQNKQILKQTETNTEIYRQNKTNTKTDEILKAIIPKQKTKTDWNCDW